MCLVGWFLCHCVQCDVCMYCNCDTAVVQWIALYSIHEINYYPFDKCYQRQLSVSWIMIHSLDSNIQTMSNWE